jgi:hypothetical protein
MEIRIKRFISTHGEALLTTSQLREKISTEVYVAAIMRCVRRARRPLTSIAHPLTPTSRLPNNRMKKPANGAPLRPQVAAASTLSVECG